MEKSYYLKTKEDELLSFKNIHELYAYFGGMFEHTLDKFAQNTINDTTITFKKIETLFMSNFVENWNKYSLSKRYRAIYYTNIEFKNSKGIQNKPILKQKRNRRTKQAGNGERNTIL